MAGRHDPREAWDRRLAALDFLTNIPLASDVVYKREQAKLRQAKVELKNATEASRRLARACARPRPL